jgi:hypothetical protein
MDYALKHYQTQVQEHTWGEEPTDMISLVVSVVDVEAKLEATRTPSSLNNTQSYHHSPKMTKEQWQKRRYVNVPPWTKKPPDNENDTR